MTRIRKVKCDEAHPACHRCISTGRYCDGYGVWSGGPNLYSYRQRQTYPEDKVPNPGPPAAVSILRLCTRENAYLEWFKCRTVVKLPGSFTSKFWNTLLFQASLSEPAVLRAVLSLSSLHKRQVIDASGRREANVAPDEQEQFMLQNYIKSISYLKPHLVAKSKASFRVALITCLVFVCLDLLRGHFETAQIHLQSGLNILREMHLVSEQYNNIFCLQPCDGVTEQWIIETFSRLYLQVEFFKHTHQHTGLVLHAANTGVSPHIFQSIKEAWKGIECLFSKIFLLTHDSRQRTEAEFDGWRSYTLPERQQCIRIELEQWLDKYKRFQRTLQGHNSADEERCNQLLSVYHTTASIMSESCERPNDEMLYDLYTDRFFLLITQLAALWETTPTATPVHVLPEHLTDTSRSIVDLGWIPPLFFTALKCRIHRLRLQAIKFLESTSHREGIWDARAAACVARKVMEVEERGFNRNVERPNDSALFSCPRPCHLSTSVLPESHRMSEIEIKLSGAPMDRILLFYKQKRQGRIHQVLRSEYNVALQRWTDEQ